MNTKITELESQIKYLKKVISDQALKQTDLLISQKKYDFLVNHVPDILYQLDENGNVLFINDSVIKYGYKPEDLIGQNILELVHPDDRSKAAYRLRERRTGKRGTRNYELRLITKHDESLNFEISSKEIETCASFVFDTEGLYNQSREGQNSFLGTLGIARDITERKQAELALIDSEQLLSSLFMSIQEGISILDPDLNVILVNDVMREWYKDKLPLEGRKCYECYHDTNHTCNNCPSQRCLKSGKTEKAIVSGFPNSLIEWLEVYSYPMKDPDTGTVTGVVEFVRNITDKVKAEKEIERTKSALKESEIKYRGLLERTFEVTIKYTPEGQITFISPQVEKYGYSQAEVIHQNVMSFVIPEDRDQAMTELQKMLETGQEFPSEYRIQGKNGNIYWIESISKIHRNSKGEITELNAVIHDITDRKRVELYNEQLMEELTGALREISQLKGIIPICSHCKSVRDDKGFWEKVESYIQKHSEAKFSHSICPDCLIKFYPDMLD